MVHPTPQEEDQLGPVRTSIWNRVQSVAKTLSLPLAILGGIGFAAGGLLYILEDELRSFGLILLAVGSSLLFVSLFCP